jgi:hypothetical protein
MIGNIAATGGGEMAAAVVVSLGQGMARAARFRERG